MPRRRKKRKKPKMMRTKTTGMVTPIAIFVPCEVPWEDASLVLLEAGALLVFIGKVDLLVNDAVMALELDGQLD